MSSNTSKTKLILTAGKIAQGNNNESLIRYINRLNSELGFSIPTNRSNNKKLEIRPQTLAKYMVDTLNEFEFGLHEGDNINDNTITRFINRIKEEYPLNRPIDIEDDLKDYGFKKFVQWIRNNDGLQQEASSMLDSSIFNQPNNETNIIQTIIRILNEHDFA